MPVFLVMGAGYLAAWRGMMTDSAIAGLMKFAQAFAIPVILATQMAKMNVWASFHPAPLISFYAGALAAFAGFRALLGAFAGSQVAPAALGLALDFMQMLAWQYVEVPLLVLLPVWLLPLLEWALRNKPWFLRWALLILLAGVGAGLSLWKVWPEASLY